MLDWTETRERPGSAKKLEVSDADCLMMVTEHYLMKRGLHTRGVF